MDWKKSILEHKVFWIVLAFIFILPIVVLMSQVGQNNLAGNAIQTISYLQAGNDIFFEVNVAGVKSISLTTLEDVKAVKVLTEEIDNVNWNFNGKVYSMFEVSSFDEEKFTNLVFTLRIQEVDLKSIGLKKEDVRIYQDGEELNIELTRMDDDYVYYELVSNEMGEFLIGKEDIQVEDVVIVEEAEVVEEPIKPELEQPTPLPVIEEEVSEEQVEPVVEEVESKGFFTGAKDFFVELFY
jgi:PGF-pre-PGF domain-containing protein